MINIAQPNSIAWPPPASGAVAPVAAVAAIRPLQESARNGQPGAGREQGAPAAHTDARAAGRDSSRQARDAGREAAGGTNGRVATAGEESGDLLTRREAEQKTKQLALEQAAEEARRAQRLELLAHVWKASAAVVDRVLGQGESAALNAVSASSASAAPGRQPIEQLSLPWPVMPQDSRPARSRSEFPAPQDVVAYDERGHSNLASLETGVLISRRV